MTDTEDQVRARLDRAIRPGDPHGVADVIFDRARRRAIRRKVERSLLALAVVSATTLGFVGLRSLFDGPGGPTTASGSGSTDPPPVKGPSLDAPPGPVEDAPDSTILFTSVDRDSGRQAIFTIDPRTGQVGMIAGTDIGTPESAVWSPDGEQIAFTRESESGIFVMDAGGGNVRHLSIDSHVNGLQWSPDGTRIAYSAETVAAGTAVGDQEMYIRFVATDDVARLGPGTSPAWSPDGKRLVFSDEETNELSIMDANGSNIVSLGVQGFDPDWSPDGESIAFVGGCGQEEGSEAICTVGVGGTELTIIAAASGVFSSPAWSPDGDMIAFSYDLPEWAKGDLPSGGSPHEHEVYVMRADGSYVYRLTDLSNRRLRNSGTYPDWQPTGP